MKLDQLTQYEKARVLGARALQIAMNAPLLMKINQEDLEKVKFDALKIAEIELESGALPMSVKKPFPEKKEDKLKRVKAIKMADKEEEEKEAMEEEEIAKQGDIMALANPDDENEETLGDDYDGE